MPNEKSTNILYQYQIIWKKFWNTSCGIY